MYQREELIYKTLFYFYNFFIIFHIKSYTGFNIRRISALETVADISKFEDHEILVKEY